MFKSYSITPVENDLFRITIIDDEFEEQVYSMYGEGVCAAALRNTIRIYSERNLNVAKNLFFYLKYEQKIYHFSYEFNINYYRSVNSSFKDYLPEINKYLLFS